MNFRETSGNEETLIYAEYNGRSKEAIELSSEFSNDVKMLSKAVIGSCWKGRLNVVKWLKEYTAADVNCNNSEVLWGYTPLRVACESNLFDI